MRYKEAKFKKERINTTISKNAFNWCRNNGKTFGFVLEYGVKTLEEEAITAVSRTDLEKKMVLLGEKLHRVIMENIKLKRQFTELKNE